MCQRLGGIISNGYDAWANYNITELIIGYSNFPSDSSDYRGKRFISSRKMENSRGGYHKIGTSKV